MGLKIFFENLRHKLTPASAVENARHEAVIEAINISRRTAITGEFSTHMHKVVTEVSRYSTVLHDSFENFRHGVSVIGEELRHNLYSELINIIH